MGIRESISLHFLLEIAELARGLSAIAKLLVKFSSETHSSFTSYFALRDVLSLNSYFSTPCRLSVNLHHTQFAGHGAGDRLAGCTIMVKPTCCGFVVDVLWT